MSDPALRPGSVDDLAATVRLFDANVAWLTERGREGQWGDQPWTGEPDRERFVRDILTAGDVWVAVVDDADPAGVLVVSGNAPPYVEPAGEPELYVLLLIADPRLRGAGVGAALLAHARSVATDRGVDLVRVDCWAGGDGRLVEYYESQGFRRTSAFDSDGWIGQVLELRLSD